MSELLDVVILGTLWASGLSLGLGFRPRELGRFRARRALFVRVLLFGVVVVPLAVWALAIVAAVPSGYATGLLIVGAASGGPLGIKAVQIVKGDPTLAVALIVVFELANILVVPFWTTILLPVAVRLPVDGVLRTLVIGILLPIGVGMLIRQRWPAHPSRLPAAASMVSTIGLVVVIILMVASGGRAILGAIGTGVPLVTLLTVAIAMIGGWLAGGPDRPSRSTSAMVVSIRASAPSLAVAVAAFGPAADATVAITVFAVLAVVVTAPVAAIIGRWSVTSSAVIADARGRA